MQTKPFSEVEKINYVLKATGKMYRKPLNDFDIRHFNLEKKAALLRQFDAIYNHSKVR